MGTSLALKMVIISKVPLLGMLEALKNVGVMVVIQAAPETRKKLPPARLPVPPRIYVVAMFGFHQFHQ